jgi:hypothetical protein
MGKTSPDLTALAAFAGVLSLAETGLVISGILPPVLSYSPGNILFSLARIAVIAYAGWTAGGLKKAALNGALVSFVANLVICLATVAGKFYFMVPVLGISTPNSASLLLVLAIILAANVLLGAVIATGAALLAGKIKNGKV